MRRSLRRALVPAILLSILPFAGRAHALAYVGFDPDPPTLFRKGQIATISVRIQSSTPVQAFDLDVAYDPTLLSVVAVNGNHGFDGNDTLTYPPAIDATSGTIRGIVDARLGTPGPSGNVLVADLVFRVLRTGEAPIRVLGFSQRKGMADASGAVIPAEAGITTVTVASSLDSDLDGLSDAYEQVVLGTDPHNRDTNADGIPDGLDDLDGDGLIPVQEYARGTYEGTADSDQDGVGDATDDCPTTWNASQADGDGDGLGDACDPDRDQDRIEDVAEPALGLDPSNPDTDGDGALDGLEILAGTNPLDPQSTPVSIPTLDDAGALALALLLIPGAAQRLREGRRPGPR